MLWITIIVALSLLYYGYDKKKGYELEEKKIELEQKKIDLEMKKLDYDKRQE
ncbi:hypothetical protein [Bacillus suaedae]|uniref:Uncharacterized protein n=1 Tax=Halalkalibacter suaedae TaxID=2822140 RepID=A0A940WV03_9BACI|nr:hypothetical protein [Bacillus suaedae]MBP3950977.1 hypothetical protein [Bacillus suaedae]